MYLDCGGKGNTCITHLCSCAKQAHREHAFPRTSTSENTCRTKNLLKMSQFFFYVYMCLQYKQMCFANMFLILCLFHSFPIKRNYFTFFINYSVKVKRYNFSMPFSNSSTWDVAGITPALLELQLKDWECNVFLSTSCPLVDQIVHSVMKRADPCLSLLTDVGLRRSSLLICNSNHGHMIRTWPFHWHPTLIWHAAFTWNKKKRKEKKRQLILLFLHPRMVLDFAKPLTHRVSCGVWTVQLSVDYTSLWQFVLYIFHLMYYFSCLKLFYWEWLCSFTQNHFIPI